MWSGRIARRTNEEVGRRVGVTEEINDRAVRKVLEVVWTVESNNEQWMTERGYNMEVEGRRVRGRPCARG